MSTMALGRIVNIDDDIRGLYRCIACRCPLTYVQNKDIGLDVF